MWWRKVSLKLYLTHFQFPMNYSVTLVVLLCDMEAHSRQKWKLRKVQKHLVFHCWCEEQTVTQWTLILSSLLQSWELQFSSEGCFFFFNQISHVRARSAQSLRVTRARLSNEEGSHFPTTIKTHFWFPGCFPSKQTRLEGIFIWADMDSNAEL